MKTAFLIWLSTLALVMILLATGCGKEVYVTVEKHDPKTETTTTTTERLACVVVCTKFNPQYKYCEEEALQCPLEQEESDE